MQCSPARVVPPRGVEPLPSIFGESRPIPGTVANTGVLPHRQRSPWPRLHFRCVVRHARAKSALTGKRRRVERTTSSIPASFGSVALTRTTSSGHDQLGRNPRASRRPRRTCAGGTSPAPLRCRCRPAVTTDAGLNLCAAHRAFIIVVIVALGLSEIARCIRVRRGRTCRGRDRDGNQVLESQNQIVVMSDTGDTRPETSKGHPVFLGGPSARGDGESQRQKGPPHIPTPRPTGNRRDGVPAGALASGR